MPFTSQTQGAFLHLRVLWGNAFPIAQHNRMKSWVDLSAVQGTWIPQKYANKNLFRLPHRKCSLQSISSQDYPDQNSLSHNEDNFLMTSIQRWGDVKNHEFPIIHLLSNYALQSLKSPENNFFLILLKETQRDWFSLCSPDWLRIPCFTHQMLGLQTCINRFIKLFFQ